MIGRRLLEAWGIDAGQWRVLTRTMLKLDFRVGGFGGRAFGHQGTPKQQAVMSVILYVTMGLMSAGIAALIDDVFFSGVVVLTLVMFMVGSILLLDYQSVITSPDDFRVLGHQPVSSRTYFAVRLANVLFYMAIPATAFAVPSAVAYALFVDGVDPMLGAAALLAVYGAALMVTLAIIVSYGAVLRFVSAERLARGLGYFQMVLGFAVYGVYPLLGYLEERTLQNVTLEKTGWVLLHPASWFASYLDLAAGRMRIVDVIPALLSVAALGALARWVSGRLSLDYAGTLGEMLAAGAPARSREAAPGRRRSWLGGFFRGGEARAVVLLARAQFRHDQKFRLGVLGILPLTVLYLLMSMRQGGVGDPFVRSEGFPSQSPLLLVAVLLFPIMLKAALARSDSYRASWIFYAAPADHVRIVKAMKRYLITYFVVPYLALVAAVYTYYFDHAGHAVAHVAMLGLISHLFLQLAVWLDPDLPFSQPMRKGERSGLMAALMAVQMFTAFAGIAILTRWVYPSVLLTAVTMGALLALSLGLDQLLAGRVRRLSARWEYIE